MFTTDADNQTQVEVCIYEGERYNVPTQIEFPHCKQLDSFGAYYLYR